MPNTRFDWVGPGLVIASRYRIESQLGEGGYGAVFVATQLGLERRVALKLLHPEVLVRDRARERFVREAQITQALAHPNIVRLFEFGTSEQGVPFIVTELLEGRSLEQELVSRGPIAPDRVAHITQQILKGLAEAHQRGIVHRDVKPANVFLCDYAGEPDFVKLLDFGIAAAPKEGNAGLTQEGVSLGTPAYMSPEQVLDQPLDGRSDLYSVGLVMAEMLTGRTVFQGSVGMQIALTQIAPNPVPLAPEVVSGPLGPFVVRATQKDREHRFTSALEMLHALRQSMGSMGISAPLHAPQLSPAGAIGSPLAAPAPLAAVSGGHASLPYARTNSSVSMPLAAPAAPPPPARSDSKVALIVACAVLGAIAIAAVTYAVTVTRMKDDKKTASSVATLKVPPHSAPERDVDPADAIEKQVERMEKELLDELIKVPTPGCTLSPEAAAFTVKGVTVAQAVERLQKAGYSCISFAPIAGVGTLSLDKDPASVVLQFRSDAPMLSSSVAMMPGSVLIVDADGKRAFWFMTGDDGDTAARAASQIVFPASPAPQP
ncbi:MAG: serine/threonine protein kinase [Polyangiaceae bacterium]|jgi:serine/threonine protein kinase|nr:serine/threonine protein kinase [Polyangiaceae bacterium]